MTHLRQRRRASVAVTYVSIGVRGERAAATVVDAKEYAQARGVTFGSLVMEALAEYMDQAHLEAQQVHADATARE